MTVRVARRAKPFHREAFNNPNLSAVKPVTRAILEMSDELVPPQLIPEQMP